MSELFEIKPMDSPRLAWLKKHNVQTNDTKMDCDDGRWIAFIGESQKFVSGETEADAIANLALREGWPLWNEENL